MRKGREGTNQTVCPGELQGELCDTVSRATHSICQKDAALRTLFSSNWFSGLLYGGVVVSRV